MGSQVVSLEMIRPGVALIRMQDTVNKNTFTNELITGLTEGMETAENNPAAKCIVLTGFGNYFATGGTQEALLAIQAGQNSFLDAKAGGKNVYNLPMTCKIPVIAAMQGHAMGGGLAMGLFSDLILLARESIYSASFMKYGFTPGFGSTLIFPERFGTALGTEMLMTARTYHGADLEKRGIPYEVCPRSEVLERAVGIAESLAEKPRRSLELLKARLTEDILERLPGVIEEEMRMHDETFHLPEVRENIMKLYN